MDIASSLVIVRHRKRELWLLDAPSNLFAMSTHRSNENTDSSASFTPVMTTTTSSHTVCYINKLISPQHSNLFALSTVMVVLWGVD